MDISFGRWIKRRRRLLDLTQKELADQVGCSPVTVRKLESDERRPSKQLAERLSHYLTIPPEDLARFLAYARMGPDFDPTDAPTPHNRPQWLLSTITTPQIDWGEAPDVRRFYGRTAELAHLRRWLIDEGCRLVVILGMGGIGKTSLATKLAQGVQGQFEAVIWRSLRNAPPAEDTMDEILRSLMPGAAFDPVPNLERQLRRLLEQLRQRRCLIILDNFEAILAEGARAGTYRTGYGGYGELLKRVGESRHQSCLLVTSREHPTEVGMWEGADTVVRVLQLSSLASDDSRALLADKGLSGEAESWATLSAHYSGNPLVLQVVGETIRELFQGSIETFLQYETALFASIRDLLAGQFARLSPLEQSVVIWLAVHREPVGPEMLRDDLEPAPNWAALLDALHSLRRRSLVEQNERGFTLQNVVLEFVTEYLVDQIMREVTAQEAVLLQHYALHLTQAWQYVRDSQTRLLLKPVVDRLVAVLGKVGVEMHLSAMLTSLRRGQAHPPGYAAGNLLNLLVQLNGHLRGQDFSGLAVCQANLQGVNAQGASFRGAHLDKCTFSFTFSGILAMAFSSTGGYLAIASEIGVHCLQRVQDDYPLHRYLHSGGTVCGACFSPDGSLVAAAGTDCMVRIWATESGRSLHTLSGHAGSVWSVCFSPDGRLVASGGADGTIRIWDAQSGQCLVTLLDHAQGVRGIAFSPGGDLLASGSEDGTIRLWANPGRLQDLHCVHVLTGHSGMVRSLAFSPDGALLASGGHDRTIRLWDVQTSQPLATLTGHTQYVTQVCFSPDGLLLASGGFDATVRLWDIITSHCVRTLQGHSGRIMAVAYSPDGSVLASGGSDQSVRLWDVDPVSGSGRCLKALHGYTNAIRSVAFNPDGTRVAGASRDTSVRLWDAHSGRCLATLLGHTGGLWHVTFSPDGGLLVSAGHDPIIRVWEVASGRCVHEIEKAEGCDATSFHPSGTLLATANLDRTIDLWDVRSWQLLTTLRGHTSEVWAVAFSPDGSLLASGSMGGRLRLWDWHSGRCLHEFEGHTSYVKAVSFSPDGTLLASSSYDSTVRLWDVAHPVRGEGSIATLPGPGGAAQLYVAYSPDGQLLASAGVDGTVCLWTVSGALGGSLPLCVLEGHTGKVFSVGFRADGRILASSGEDGTIRLWDVEDVPRGVTCVQVLQVELPYARMNIAGVTGLTQVQINSLLTLGAVDAG